MAVRVQNAVGKVDFKVSGYEESLPVGINIGVAGYPESGQNPYTILAAADRNLTEAKKNRVTVMTSAPPPDTSLPRDARAQSLGAVDMMLTAIDNVDSYTRKHSEDVLKYAVWICEEIGASQGTIDQVSTSAMLHDVGKIAVPATILRKPGALTDEEYELMKRHTTIGGLIVRAITEMNDVVDGVLYHHERYDGRGYPEGLEGENIPWLGRILAVADAFSAMTTDRPYRKGMDWPEAAQRINNGIGTQFDPKLAEAFLNVLEARGVEIKREAVFDRHQFPNAA